MQSDAHHQHTPLPDKGLPPVAPPSGRFIAQLFLVPGLIVTFAVLFILGLNYLFVESRDARQYLHKLDSANADIRWRGAHDLAQELKRPDNRWRSDPVFALDLAERLQTSLADLKEKEISIGKQVKGQTEKQQDLAWMKLNTQRDHVRFLASALGDFVVPVGIPLLCEMALNTDGPDLKGNTDQRRKAVWALGNLGENLKSFAKLPAEKQAEIRDRLRDEASGSNARASWARNALVYLDPTISPTPDGVVRVDQALAKCARDEDRFLRRLTALVLSFWDGPLVEPTLLELTRDDGHGTLVTSPAIE